MLVISDEIKYHFKEVITRQSPRKYFRVATSHQNLQSVKLTDLQADPTLTSMSQRQRELSIIQKLIDI